MTDRLARWRAAVAAAEHHVDLGRSLQGRGLAILNSIPLGDDRRQIDFDKIDASGLAKLISNATSAIDRGAKLEREAHDTLMRLAKIKPVAERKK